MTENAQDVIVTINTQTGSDPSATTDLWVDDVSIIYVPDPAPASSITDPTDLSYLNGAAADPYTISGDATDNAGVEKIEVSINGGGWTEATCVGCPGTSVTWTYDWTLPVDGSYTIQSRATDSSTNVETPSAGITVTVDRADPASAVTDPTDPDTINGTDPDPYTVSGTATDNDGVASIEFYDGATWQPAVCTGCPGTSVTWTYSWTLPGDGGYTVNSRATDSAGNVETPGAGNSVTISTTGPAVLSTVPADGAGSITPDTNVTITFDTNTVDCATVTDTTVSYSDGAANWTKVDCQIDQPIAGQTLATFATSNQQSATVYIISVTTAVLDTIGNPATAYQFSYTTTDIDPPVSYITDPVDATAFNNGSPGTINITGTATDNVGVSSVDVFVTGIGWTGATCVGCPGTNVVWTYAWTRPGTDGSYTIQSRATDAEPNIETPAAGNTVTLDVSVPSSTIIAPANNTYLSSGDFPYNINGSAADTGTNITGVEVSTDGGNSWTAAVCTGCPGTNVTWSYSWTTPSIESSYVVRARATDAGNNVEVPAAGNTATYDNTAPVVASASPDNNDSNVAVDRDVVITFTEDNLDCGTVNTTNITSDSPGWTLSNCDDVTGIVTFTTSGQSNYTTYNANVTTSVADKSGNTLASAYPISYTVGTQNAAPGNPSSLAQYKTDDSTQITQGATTDETSIVIWANVTDSDSDNVNIEAEIVLNASSFTGTPNCTIGDPVSAPGTAKVTCSNLADGSSYKWQVRAFDGRAYSSWVDYSGGNPDVQIVTLLSASPLLHNSTNTGSSKWGGSWGEQGGQYGEFVCTTCHTDSTTNIKRIKQTIVAPNSPTNDFPGSSVTFTDPREGSSNFGDDTGGHSTSTKVCEACHSQDKYHNYDTPNNTGGVDHNNQRNCMQCHYHKDGFKPSGGGGDCTSCHNGIPGTTYVSRNVVGSDFTQSSRHVFGSGATVTNWDCIVCHKEGDEALANGSPGEAATTSFHPFSNGTVDLRDVDNPTNPPIVVWDKYAGVCDTNPVTWNYSDICISNLAKWTWNNDAMLTGMDNFCMGCHDSDSSRGTCTGGTGGTLEDDCVAGGGTWSGNQGGASGIAVNSASDGVTLTPNATLATRPFNNTDELDTGAGGGSVTVAGYERTAVMDAYGMFDTTNESFHAVRGPAYSGHNADWGDTAWVNRPLKNGTSLMTNYEASTLHCADCHTVDQNAHGGSNIFMLQASTIDDTCYLCHNSTTYSDNKTSTDTRWWHGNETQAWGAGNETWMNGSICRSCHGGLIGDGGSFTDGYGGIHGMDTGLQGADPKSGQPRYRFQGGIYMSHLPGSWTAASGTSSCYFDASSKTVDWSKCGQHSGNTGQRTATPRFSRGIPGDY
jgi:hypothetical protein